MELKIYFLNNYNYKSNKKLIPFSVEISSEREITIAEKVDINEILLKSLSNNNEVYGAYFKCHFGLPQNTLILTRNKPYLINYDFANYDPELIVVPGDYELFIEITIYIKNNNGVFVNEVLRASERINFK